MLSAGVLTEDTVGLLYSWKACVVFGVEGVDVRNACCAGTVDAIDVLIGVIVGAFWCTGDWSGAIGVAGIVLSSNSMSSKVSMSCTVDSCVLLKPSLDVAKLFCRWFRVR